MREADQGCISGGVAAVEVGIRCVIVDIGYKERGSAEPRSRPNEGKLRFMQMRKGRNILSNIVHLKAGAASSVPEIANVCKLILSSSPISITAAIKVGAEQYH